FGRPRHQPPANLARGAIIPQHAAAARCAKRIPLSWNKRRRCERSPIARRRAPRLHKCGHRTRPSAPTSPSRDAGPSLSAPAGGEGRGEVGRRAELRQRALRPSCYFRGREAIQRRATWCLPWIALSAVPPRNTSFEKNSISLAHPLASARGGGASAAPRSEAAMGGSRRRRWRGGLQMAMNDLLGL